MPSRPPDDHDNDDQACCNKPGARGAQPGVKPMTLAEQITHLRQLALADPNTTLLDLAIINILDELAEAVQELHGDDPPQGFRSV
jgi:hypothetical protein